MFDKFSGILKLICIIESITTISVMEWKTKWMEDKKN